MAIIELIAWLFCASFSWFFTTECDYSTYYSWCYTEYWGWVSFLRGDKEKRSEREVRSRGFKQRKAFFYFFRDSNRDLVRSCIILWHPSRGFLEASAQLNTLLFAILVCLMCHYALQFYFLKSYNISIFFFFKQRVGKYFIFSKYRISARTLCVSILSSA